MEKKILLIAGLCLGFTGFAMADGAISHAGGGFYASFLGTPIRVASRLDDSAFGEKKTVTLKSMPLGLSLFGGYGYAFGSEEKFSAGGELGIGSGLSLKPIGGGLHLSLQGRAYGRYTPHGEFSVSGFVGVKGNIAFWDLPSEAYPVFGVRTEFFSYYVEYAVVPKGNFSKVYSHDVSIGGIWFM